MSTVNGTVSVVWNPPDVNPTCGVPGATSKVCNICQVQNAWKNVTTSASITQLKLLEQPVNGTNPQATLNQMIIGTDVPYRNVSITSIDFLVSFSHYMFIDEGSLVTLSFPGTSFNSIQLYRSTSNISPRTDPGSDTPKKQTLNFSTPYTTNPIDQLTLSFSSPGGNSVQILGSCHYPYTDIYLTITYNFTYQSCVNNYADPICFNYCTSAQILNNQQSVCKEDYVSYCTTAQSQSITLDPKATNSYYVYLDSSVAGITQGQQLNINGMNYNVVVSSPPDTTKNGLVLNAPSFPRPITVGIGDQVFTTVGTAPPVGTIIGTSNINPLPLLTDTNCQKYFQDYFNVGLTDSNFEENLGNYCSKYTTLADFVKASSTEQSICGCYLSDDVYTSYVTELTKALSPTEQSIIQSANNRCLFPACTQQDWTFKSAGLAGGVCPNICITSVKFNNDGTISGNVGIESSCTGNNPNPSPTPDIGSGWWDRFKTYYVDNKKITIPITVLIGFFIFMIIVAIIASARKKS